LRGRNVCRCKRCGRKRCKFRRDPKGSQKKNVSVDGNLFDVVAARHGARIRLAGMVSVVAIHLSPARMRGRLRRGMMISVDRALLAGAAGACNHHQGGTGHGSVDQQQRQQANICPGRAHSRICRFFHGSIDLPIIRQVPAESRAEDLARRNRRFCGAQVSLSGLQQFDGSDLQRVTLDVARHVDTKVVLFVRRF
jgi:hypothetical protein